MTAADTAVNNSGYRAGLYFYVRIYVYLTNFHLHHFYGVTKSSNDARTRCVLLTHALPAQRIDGYERSVPNSHGLESWGTPGLEDPERV